jgi:hypothetical protein
VKNEDTDKNNMVSFTRLKHGRGLRFKVQGSRFKVQSSRFKVQSSRYKVQGIRTLFPFSFLLFTSLSFVPACVRQALNFFLYLKGWLILSYIYATASSIITY